MSLLDNASLLLTPNAYKEGKLYSVIPSNGNGDFTATRATTATRVNSAGLVDLVPYNLLRYSEMFADVSWNKQNATISANTTTAPDGTLTADKLVADATLGQHRIYQGGQTLDSGAYVVSCYAKAAEYSFFSMGVAGGVSGGNIIFNLTNGTISGTVSGITPSIQSVGNGWYRCSLAFTSATPNFSWWLIARNANNTSDYSGDGTSGIFIWGAQLVQGTSARDYLRTETRLNIPRIDYSLGGCPNILLEPQRTNLALQSSSFDNASWAKSETAISANVTTAPDGTLTADKFIPSANNATHSIRQTGFTSAAYTFSVYAKAGEETTFSLWLRSASVFAVFDLSSGTITSQSGSVTATITSVGDGWYRCTAYDPTPGTTAQLYARNGSVFAGNGANGFFIWGAQLEAGAYATSYIPTTTASVTRNADSITRNNIFTNGLITASGGTWFVELRNNRTLIQDSSSAGIYLETGTGFSNGFSIRGSSPASRFVIRKNLTPSFTPLYTTTTDTAKIAIKWNGSTADVFVNGVKVVVATAFNITNMQNLGTPTLDVPAYINQMALFPTPLTDAQCLALTA